MWICTWLGQSAAVVRHWHAQNQAASPVLPRRSFSLRGSCLVSHASDEFEHLLVELLDFILAPVEPAAPHAVVLVHLDCHFGPTCIEGERHPPSRTSASRRYPLKHALL